MVRTLALCIALLVVLPLGAHAAIDSYWTVQFAPVVSPASILSVGTATGAHDQYVPGEDAIFPTPTPGTVLISSAAGPMTRLSKDTREPITAAQAGLANAKVWDLTLAVYGGSFPPSAITLEGWVPATAKIDGSDTIVALYQNGEHLFTFEPGMSGTAGSPNFTRTFAYAGEPIALQLVAYTTVPEPSAIAALSCGLGGLLWRKRRGRKA